MPIYEYDCQECGYKFSQLIMSRNAEVKCPLCQGNVKKLMSTFSVGQSQDTVGNLPQIDGPRMCTNC